MCEKLGYSGMKKRALLITQTMRQMQYAVSHPWTFPEEVYKGDVRTPKTQKILELRHRFHSERRKVMIGTPWIPSAEGYCDVLSKEFRCTYIDMNLWAPSAAKQVLTKKSSPTAIHESTLVPNIPGAGGVESVGPSVLSCRDPSASGGRGGASWAPMSRMACASQNCGEASLHRCPHPRTGRRDRGPVHGCRDSARGRQRNASCRHRKVGWSGQKEGQRSAAWLLHGGTVKALDQPGAGEVLEDWPSRFS